MPELIRRRLDEDLEGLVSLLRSVYVSDGYPTNWPTQPARWLAGRQTIAAWVSEEDGTLVGHAALTAPAAGDAWPEWQEALGLPHDRLAVIRRLFVAPTCRRTGLGTRLVTRAAREAGGRGLELVLDVADHNHHAVAFWKKHGWRQVGHATLPPGAEGRPLRLLLFVAPASAR